MISSIDGAITSAEPPSDSTAVDRWFILALLTVTMVVSFADRTIFSMMIQPIKSDLQLSDTATGALTGFAFTLFYATFGLLMARFSDRGGARRVIILSLIARSAMTALCGLARNFWQMALTRFGVGAGEAGVVPAAQSILGKLFPPEQRSTAMAILMAGGPLGILLAFVMTPSIEAQIGWRMTFVVFGLPGLALSLLFLLSSSSLASDGSDRASVTASLKAHSIRAVFGIPLFRQALMVMVALSLMTFGQTQWLPAYVERSFAMPRATLGLLLGITQGLGMLVGTAAGGPLFDWLGARDPRWRERLMICAPILGLPFVISVYSVGNGYLAAVLAGIAALILALPAGELWAAVQRAVPISQRATGAAIVMMMASFVGQGCGPVFIGWLSDMLVPAAGAESLRYALLTTVIAGALWLLTHIFLLVRAMRAARPPASRQSPLRV